MTKIIVYHSGYGCDTGCCGHVVEWDPEFGKPPLLRRNNFEFFHPEPGSDARLWTEKLVEECYGADHVKDLDWENCLIVDDNGQEMTTS
jgi:hypothetical protein